MDIDIPEKLKRVICKGLVESFKVNFGGLFAVAPHPLPEEGVLSLLCRFIFHSCMEVNWILTIE